MSDRETTIALTEIGSHGRDKIVLGHRLAGEPFTVDRAYKAHMLVSGETGSGKGGTVRALQCHDVTVGNEIIVVQPKEGEFGWLEGVAHCPSEPDDVIAALDYAVEVMDRRQKEMGAYRNPDNDRLGVDKYEQLPDHDPDLVVYLDESPAVIGPEAFLDYDVDEIEHNMRSVAKIVKRGRSSRVRLVLITQRPTIAGTFGPTAIGGGIMNNIAQRIHCDRDHESLYAAFNHCSPITAMDLKRLEQGFEGRVAFAFCDRKDRGAVNVGQVLWVEPDQAAAIAASRTEPAEVA